MKERTVARRRPPTAWSQGRKGIWFEEVPKITLMAVELWLLTVEHAVFFDSPTLTAPPNEVDVVFE
jgi:hypothetical protein